MKVFGHKHSDIVPFSINTFFIDQKYISTEVNTKIKTDYYDGLFLEPPVIVLLTRDDGMKDTIINMQ